MNVGPSIAQEGPYYLTMHSFLKLGKGTEDSKGAKGKHNLSTSLAEPIPMHKDVGSDKER